MGKKEEQQIKKEINGNIARIINSLTIYNDEYDIYELNNPDFLLILSELMAVEVFINSYSSFFCKF